MVHSARFLAEERCHDHDGEHERAPRVFPAAH